MALKKHIASLLLAVIFSAELYSQSLTTVILPRYIEGINGTNTNRIPFAYRAKIIGLLANATYRYFNQIVRSADPATTSGAGNCLYALISGDFVRTSSPGLATAGAYGTFSTDVTGTYEGWFITEPTGNARLVPGTYIFMRIMLNDGAGGTTVALRLTATDSVRVVKLDPAASDSTGTGLRCTSSGSLKDFVFAYDDTTDTGRPVSGSFIESDGTDNSATNNYAAFYASHVDGVDGAFGVVLPNTLPTGIRRVEQRSLATGAVVAFATDADGVWPSGANTINPSGGTTEIVLAGTDLQWMMGIYSDPVVPTEFAIFQNFPNPFNPTTLVRYQLPVASSVRLAVYDLLGREVAVLVNERKGPGSHEVTFDGAGLASGVYFYRLQAGDFVQAKKLVVLR
jgi:hypothetical protein